MMVDQYTTTADETYYMQQEQDAWWAKQAIHTFEKTVDKFMELMNVSRGTAIRIMMDNEHEDGWAFYTEDDVARFIRTHHNLPEDSDQYRECFNVGVGKIVEFDHF
jgi:hypothetical protein